LCRTTAPATLRHQKQYTQLKAAPELHFILPQMFKTSKKYNQNNQL
jgi:hypothetical protein